MKPPFIRWFVAASWLVAATFVAAPTRAVAQDDEAYEAPPLYGEEDSSDYGWEDEAPSDPLRVLGSLTFGTSVRFVRDLDYSQEFVAPAYMDLWAGVVLPGNDIRHALGLSTGINLTGDGATIGVDPFNQLVLGPSYGLYIPLSDFILLPKFTIPFAVSPDPSIGFELGLGAAYRLLAGLGIYAELSASMWIGGATSIHPMGSGEIGVLIDYEVLP